MMARLTGEFSIVILVKECECSFHGSMGYGSIMPGEFWLVESHWTVTVKVVHIFNHNLGKVKWDRGCVGGPVEPSYLWWVPESWFWSTSSWFKKCDWSISICIAPFEKWEVIVANDFRINISITVNSWDNLKYPISNLLINCPFRGQLKNVNFTFEKAPFNFV